MWFKAARNGLTLAREGGGEMWGLWIGVLHCVQGVHHVRKCVEMAKANVPDDVAADIRSHLKQFDASVPHLKTVRDVLEHYEDGYALGKGHRQQPGVAAWQRTISAGLSEEWSVVPYYEDGDCERPVKAIAERYVLDLTAAVDASRQLLGSLWLTAKHL
jgi:hypothetical protein